MIIRTAQMKTLEVEGLAGFERRTLARLRQYFPKHHAHLGEEKLLEIIRYGRKLAESRGFFSERNITRYIELMCSLGSGFDQDPLMPWAKEIIADRSPGTTDHKMDRLYDRAWQYIEHASADFRELIEGRDDRRFLDGLVALGRLPVEPVDLWGEAAVTTEVRTRFGLLFPSKCAHVGDQCLEELVRYAMRTAAGHQIVSLRGNMIFITIMFVVGAGFPDDPQLPWASRVLRDASIQDPSQRVNQLYSEALRCLKEWWGLGLKTGA